MNPQAPANGNKLVLQDSTTLSGEANLKSIRALEEQIREHEMAIIKLKRARNSLLNVSTLPPELLGEIFHWNVMLEGDFPGLEERSHNFLLVCHHWFEVASRIPGLWSSWGNNLQDWTKRHLRYPMAPLDLVLDRGKLEDGPLDPSLRTALQDRAARDTIRRIHLFSEDSELLDSIVFLLAADYNEVRSSSVESFIILANHGVTPVDISDLFAYRCFPKLQRLELFNCTVSPWDLVASRTSILTTLTLCRPSPTPTTSQLLLILNSNRALREISLSWGRVPVDGGDKYSSRVPLQNLRVLELSGDLRHVFGLLNCLDHPVNMDLLNINLWNCTVEDVSETIGPYLGDYLRRRGRSRGGLRLFFPPEDEDYIALYVGDMDGISFSAVGPPQIDNFVAITIRLERTDRIYSADRVAIDLIKHIPREEIVYFRANDNPVITGDASVRFPYLRGLHFSQIPLHIAFPEPIFDGDEKVFPSLKHVILAWFRVDNYGWSPLTTFLACHASSENKLDTLEIVGSHNMEPEVEENIRKVVREFRMVDEVEIDEAEIDEIDEAETDETDDDY